MLRSINSHRRLYRDIPDGLAGGQIAQRFKIWAQQRGGAIAFTLKPPLGRDHVFVGLSILDQSRHLAPFPALRATCIGLDGQLLRISKDCRYLDSGSTNAAILASKVASEPPLWIAKPKR